MTASRIAGMATGLHHVTGITANVQANVDFYVGFLGLKLVKRTAGYADAEQLHLIYGDGHGSPGSLLTERPDRFVIPKAVNRADFRSGRVEKSSLSVALAPGYPPSM